MRSVRWRTPSDLLRNLRWFRVGSNPELPRIMDLLPVPSVLLLPCPQTALRMGKTMTDQPCPTPEELETLHEMASHALSTACREGRPLKMRIPAQAYDEDVAIGEALSALPALAARLRELEELVEAYDHEWMCLDCGNRIPKDFTNKSVGSPLDPQEIVSVCDRCGSEETGIPDDIIPELVDQRDALAKRVEYLEDRLVEEHMGSPGREEARRWEARAHEKEMESAALREERDDLAKRVVDLKGDLEMALKYMQNASEDAWENGVSIGGSGDEGTTKAGQFISELAERLAAQEGE